MRDTYVSNVHDPSLAVYKADPRHANGAAVIVAPGGGHRMLVLVNEGVAAAKALNRFGVRLADFQVLIYPGPLVVPAGAADDAPPAFIAAGSRDKCCAPPAIALYQQLVQAGVSAELHMYADTDHAFNVAGRSVRIGIQHWPDRLHDWLLDGGWLVPLGDRRQEGVPAPGL